MSKKEFTWNRLVELTEKEFIDQTKPREAILMDLLNGRPVKTSLDVKAALLSNFMLLLAVSHINALQEEWEVDDWVLLDTLIELLIFLQHVIKRSTGPLASKKKRNDFSNVLISTLTENLEEILNKMDVDTEDILDIFVGNLKDIDSFYEGCPLEVDGSPGHKGALMREGKVRIVTSLFGDYNSKDAVTFSLVYPLQLSSTIKEMQIDKFVA